MPKTDDLQQLGAAALEDFRFEEAAELFRQSLALGREEGDRGSEAEALQRHSDLGVWSMKARVIRPFDRRGRRTPSA